MTQTRPNFEAYARKFLDPTTNSNTKLQLATEIRDNIEIVHTAEYRNFLQYLFPVFYNVLRQGQPQFNDGPDQKIRNIILEILNRLPNNDLLKPYVQNLLKLSMYLLEVENEENAVICLRIIIDLHKTYRPSLEAEVQPFLDIVQKIYSELQGTVVTTFKDKPQTQQTQQPASLSEPSRATTLIRSMQSFKVLTECPIIVVLLFQLYPRFLSINIPKFMPLIVNTLGLQAPKNARQTHRSSYVDFVAAQVKTLSFLAYMLRGFAEHLKPYQENIPKYVIQLLFNCPNESASIRKELLIATRHILATEFRLGFIAQIDHLLDEKILIGTGRTAYETLRPLAYSTLADLIHHVRNELSISQLSKVIHLYSRNIHDPTLPFSIQTMSVKLLLNLVECITKKNEEGKGRALLIRILDAFVNKFSSLKKIIPKLIDKPASEDEPDAKATDNVKDCRMLIKTLVLGLKNIVWGISSCNVNRNGKSSVEESLIFTNLLKNGLKCFSIYSVGTNPSEEKEILDHFAAVFNMVDQRIFQDVFSLQMPFLFDRMVENQTISTIPQHFLANPGVSRMFADILLNFLIERMKNLAGPDKIASSMLLKLFKLVFGSVTLFAENEPVLQPHLSTIIPAAMKHATEVKDSVNYFYLLRALFQSIGGGKFDLFFKEFLPLLPPLLEGLNRLQNSSHSQTMRELFVELSLTVPVRLSALIPCMRLLMRPLLLALEGSPELVSQGLRTLELCVDTFSPEYLDPILDEVRSELMTAIWKHLKPPGVNPQVLRILGKLAGRNRKFLQDPVKLRTADFIEPAFNLTLTLDSSSIQLPLDIVIRIVQQKLLSNAEIEHKKQAALFLKVCLSTFLSTKDKESSISPIEEAVKTSIMPRKIDAERDILKILIDSIIISASQDKLEEVVDDFFADLCLYFAVSFANPKRNQVNHSVFIDSLLGCITNENRSLSTTVIKAFDYLIDGCKSLVEDYSSIPEFGEIARQLCHSCYHQEWHSKSGGCLGISHLTSKFPSIWVINHEVIFVKALLFVLKDLLPEVSVATVEEAFNTLTLVLKTCFSQESTSYGKLPQYQEASNEVISLLTCELSNSNSTVRMSVQKCIRLISELTGKGMTVLLEPFKSALFSPIFSRNLRSLPHTAQTGYLDALTFSLNLRPTLVSFTQELLRLLHGALSIAEREDASPKVMSQKQSQILVNLRMASIELLSAAMNSPDFQGQEQQEFRNRVIGVFFKALTLRSKEIVNVAKKGLHQVILQQKLPKELLQTSLRPVLLNLADYRKLSVPLLQGLSRLLELLTTCFNVTLGEKLLEHLGKWTDPNKAPSAKIWKDGEEIKIAASIIEIFHLLPRAASKFLEPLVLITIQLESQLPREVSSPYRIPLIKFLNTYSTDSIDYFLQRLSQPQSSKLFRFILREEVAGPLREELARNPQKLINATFQQTQNQLEVQFQGILLIRTLVKFMPDWLSQDQNRGILDCLVQIWRSPDRVNRLINDENVPLHQLKESKLIVKCFLNYCIHAKDKEEINILFYMLSVFTLRTTIDFTFLKDFYATEVAQKYSPHEKKMVVLRFLQFFREKQFLHDHKVQALRILIIPMLSASFANCDYVDIIDQRIVAAIISEILESKPGESYDEALSIELLQLATLLVRFMPTELVENRKELIKFAWSHLRSEDITTRQCAYVLVCRFIEAYETPAKIILQVYVALLRAFQPEARQLVQQALDVLLQALQKRLPAGNDLKYPTWIKWTKKIIVEEGHSLPQLIHILQLIVRHPDLFYQSRGQFVPHMVNSLARVGLLPNAPPENRKLAVELAELIIKWEHQRISGNNNTQSMEIETQVPQSMENEDTTGGMEIEEPTNVNSTPLGPVPNSEVEFKVTPTIAEMIINFLIRIASTSSDSSELADKSLHLLRNGLGMWPDASIKFAYFEKLLTSTQDQSNLICVGLSILNIIIDFQVKKFITDTMPQLQTALIPSFSSVNIKVIEAISAFLEKIMQAYPISNKESEISSFYQSISDILETNLSNYEKSTNIHCTVFLIKTISNIEPEFLDRYLPLVVKVFQKLAKDHVNPVPRTESKEGDQLARLAASNASKKIVKDTSMTLLLCLELLNSKILQLGDNKKLFFSSILLLIEKSADIELLSEITKTISSWIKEIDVSLSGREKVQFLQKMTRFEQLANPQLQAAFLDLVYHVFNDPSIKSDWPLLETGFMMGLRSKDTSTRNRFFEIFNRDISYNLSDRLHYIFSTQNWEPMGNTFWIKQAIDLLFAVIDAEACSIQIGFNPESFMDLEEKANPIEQNDILLQRYDSFLRAISSIQLSDLLNPLRELFYQDSHIAFSLWTELFPSIWSTLSQETTKMLSEELSQFLAKDYHIKQQRGHPNVIQALIKGIVKCNPFPTIPPELLKYLGKTFNVWHNVIHLLENSLLNDSQETNYDLLAELYRLLSEHDLYYGLWKRRTKIEETKVGLTLEQYGEWQKAQEVFLNAMNKGNSNELKSLSSSEIALWEQHWLNCAKRLNQWDLLTDFSRAQNNSELLLECAWKISDWSSMKEALSKTNVPPDNPYLRLYQCYTAIHDGKAQDVETISNQVIQSAVKYWQSLPDLPSYAHIPSLELFQQIIELKESAQIIKEINSPNKVQAIPEIKVILPIWRNRLPNYWDDILTWSDVLTWRQHIFSLLNSAFLSPPEGNPSAAHIGHHETAWTINKFAQVARKQKLIEVALSSLSKIYTLPNIEIQDAFTKLKEQIKCYSYHTSQYRTGLEMIINTNLDYFSPQQKAEFFKMKGDFLFKLGQNEETQAAFSTCISLFDGLGKGWYSWGLFCDHQYCESKDLTWAEYAITCFLNGVRLDHQGARRSLSRVLWLLGFDDENERLAKRFENFLEILPVWIWIPWIPQLLSSLSRAEAPYIKTILSKVSALHPQSLFYPLRSFIAEKREQISTAFPTTEMSFIGEKLPKKEEKSNVSSFYAKKKQDALKYAEEIMASLKSSHPGIGNDLETFVKEISTYFMPEREEVLLNVLQVLLVECYKTSSGEIITETLRRYTESSYQRLFPPFLSGSSSSLAAVNKKYPQFLHEYRHKFEVEIVKAKNLHHLIANLKNWINKIQSVVDKFPTKLHLEEICPNNSHLLVEFQNNIIEVPGQYNRDIEPSPDNHIKIDRIHPEIYINRTHRYLQLRGNNGKLYSFQVQSLPSMPLFSDRGEESIQQLVQLFVDCLNKFKETRKRNLPFSVPFSIPISPRLRLIPQEIGVLSLQQVFMEYHHQEEKDFYAPLDMYQTLRKNNSDLKQIYDSISEKVPQTILKNFVSSLIPSYMHLFSFKKQFVSELAMHSMIGFILGIGNRTPENILFRKETGSIIQSSFYPEYQTNGQIQYTDTVPFRLTRNLQTFLNPLFIDGYYNSIMSAVAMCLAEYKDKLRHSLSIFLRDDFSSWQNSEKIDPYEGCKTENEARTKLKTIVELNTSKVIERIQLISPPFDKENFTPINKQVSELIMIAQNPQLLAQMNPTWSPWY